jgi:hypothetical protein
MLWKGITARLSSKARANSSGDIILYHPLTVKGLSFLMSTISELLYPICGNQRKKYEYHEIILLNFNGGLGTVLKGMVGNQVSGQFTAV